jgi:hypothetical protein
MTIGGAGWVGRYHGLLLGAVLGCGASPDGTGWDGEGDAAEAARAEDAEADALVARFVLPEQAPLERLELVDEIDALPPELSRRFQYRLLDYSEAHSICDQGSGRDMRRALTEVGVENELFGLNLPESLIEEAMWRAFASRGDEWDAEQVERVVASYSALLGEMTPRARRDKGLSPIRELGDPVHAGSGD